MEELLLEDEDGRPPLPDPKRFIQTGHSAKDFRRDGFQVGRDYSEYVNKIRLKSLNFKPGSGRNLASI